MELQGTARWRPRELINPRLNIFLEEFTMGWLVKINDRLNRDALVYIEEYAASPGIGGQRGYRWTSKTAGKFKVPLGVTQPAEKVSVQGNSNDALLGSGDRDDGTRFKCFRLDSFFGFLQKLQSGAGWIYDEGAAGLAAGLMTWTQDVQNTSEEVSADNDDGTTASADDYAVV
jgi:hypothetical protein